MRLLLSWVREFVDVSAPPEAIAEALALRGFEAASIDRLPGGDAVVDFEVTANRPDCLGVLGFARELATAYDVALRLPTVESGALAPVTSGDSDRLRVTLDAAELCPRYAAAVAELADTRTPAWMVDRLEATGIRPISPLVDITNYVLMELGHPMHAFDLARLAGPELRVRRATAGERITTLDGVDRALDSDMLVIADARRPQAVAGVMGGADSEVGGTTRTVALESACFHPPSVRRTSKQLGLKTEASARFERGADISAPVMALQRAIRLMEKLEAGRVVGPVIDRYPQPRAPRALPLRRSRLELLLGMSVPDAEVVRILKGLGLEVSTTRDGWSALAPTFRVDLMREVDLIEEVGRHYGYDKLEPAFPNISTIAPPPDPRIARDRLVGDVLTSAGLSEAITFSFIDARAARLFAAADGASDGLVPVANPLSAKFDTLRPSLLPGLVDAVAHNRRHGRRDVRLFEIGARFRLDTGETHGVGVAWTGAAVAEHWSGPARDVDFFDIKGVVEQVASAMRAAIAVEPCPVAFLTPGQAAAIRAGGDTIGWAGVMLPAIAEERGAPGRDAIVVAELDLDRLAALGDRHVPRVQPLPRYPSVVRDLSIVVSDTLPAATIRGTIQAASADASAPLVAVQFFDRYRGKGVPDGTVSVSVRLTFQAPDRTLTDADVQRTFDGILGALVHDHRAVQR